MKREKRIVERLRQMQSKYRVTYRRAVEGRSLRACINSQCLECCGWERAEEKAAGQAPPYNPA